MGHLRLAENKKDSKRPERAKDNHTNRIYTVSKVNTHPQKHISKITKLTVWVGQILLQY